MDVFLWLLHLHYALSPVKCCFRPACRIENVLLCFWPMTFKTHIAGSLPLVVDSYCTVLLSSFQRPTLKKHQIEGNFWGYALLSRAVLQARRYCSVVFPVGKCAQLVCPWSCFGHRWLSSKVPNSTSWSIMEQRLYRIINSASLGSAENELDFLVWNIKKQHFWKNAPLQKTVFWFRMQPRWHPYLWVAETVYWCISNKPVSSFEVLPKQCLLKNRWFFVWTNFGLEFACFLRSDHNTRSFRGCVWKTVGKITECGNFQIRAYEKFTEITLSRTEWTQKVKRFMKNNPRCTI